jgi:uncharacterized protein (DUF342 family)
MGRTVPKMMSEEKGAQDIPKILSRGLDNWKILIRLGMDELLDNRTLLTKLFEIKKHLSESEGVPLALLSYEGIVERRQLESEMQIVVRIIRLPIEKGEPVIHFSTKQSSDGIPYADMEASIDIYPFDSFEQIITLKKVLAIVRQSGIAEDMINPWLIRQKVRQVSEAMRSIKGVTIAEGHLPDPGTDAKIDFYFPAQPSEDNSHEYYGSRRVKKGDVICCKTPPKDGENPGTNVKGVVIPPRKGIDVELRAHKGVVLSFDKQEAKADADGIVVIKWIEVEKVLVHGKKLIPTEVQLRVNSVMKVKGDQKVDITTDKAVEVEGNLTIGSRIVTNAEVHVSGSVLDGTVINSLDDITVDGDVIQSELSSEKNVVTQGNISDSKIMAKERVIVNGEIRHTRVVGKDVTANRIVASNISAKDYLCANCLDDDESDVISSITVGVQDFLRSRLEENKEYLGQAQTNFSRMGELFGDALLRKVTHSNVQQLWVKYIASLRSKNKSYNRSQLEDLKTLFENIPTLRIMIEEKTEENGKMEQQISDTGEEAAMVVVRERVGRSQEVTLGGTTAKLEPCENGVQVSNLADQKDGGQEVAKEPLKESMQLNARESS